MRQAILTRRALLGGFATFAITGPGLAADAPKLSEDGLYQQPWFVQSLLDLRDDFRAATDSGKTFAVLWELRNCPWCKMLHTVNFAHSEIAAYTRDNFDIVQLNWIGARPVTDFDGTEQSEKALAAKWEVQGTPTLHFFIPSETHLAREAGRTMYLKPGEFLEMLRFVRAKAYEEMPFDQWLLQHPPRF